MRQWIQVNLSHLEDYRQSMPVFEQSIRYLLEQQEQKKT